MTEIKTKTVPASQDNIERKAKYEDTPEGKAEFVFDHVLELVAFQQGLIMKVNFLYKQLDDIKAILADSKIIRVHNGGR